MENKIPRRKTGDFSGGPGRPRYAHFDHYRDESPDGASN